MGVPYKDIYVHLQWHLFTSKSVSLEWNCLSCVLLDRESFRTIYDKIREVLLDMCTSSFECRFFVITAYVL